MQEIVATYLGIAVTSSIKYLFGVLACIAAGFNLLETLITTLGGGMAGVFVYIYLWDAIVWLYSKVVPPKIVQGIKINNRLRFLVKVIKKYELYGVAFLTPILLSVPVGVIVALAFEEDKWRIKRYMFFSFLGWTLAVYGLSSLLGINIQEWFNH